MAENRSPGKERFSSLDALALGREVRSLGRAFVDKIYDAPSGGLVISLRAPGVGRRFLHIAPGSAAFLTAEPPVPREELSPFARDLRRLLTSAGITGVPNPSGERLLEITLGRGDLTEPLQFVVELFGAGNVIVVRGSTVVAVAHPKSWAHRTLRIGAEYLPPPSRGDSWELGIAELSTALLASRADRVSTLAARLGFGGPIAEEILVRAGLASGAPATEDPVRSATAIHEAIRSILGEVADPPKGYVYWRGTGVVDYEPFGSRRWRADPTIREEELPQFSAAVRRHYEAIAAIPAPPPPPSEREAELTRRIERQQEAVEGLRSETERLKSAADSIYAHYAEVEKALSEVVDPAEGVPPPTLKLDGAVIELDPRASVEENARRLYEERTRLRSKLAGARAALDSAREEVATSPAEGAAAPPKQVRARVVRWFERYRWFVSSEGLLVIGGRDASTNDQMVKKYLGEKDLYLHADIHGASSVIIKQPQGAPALPIGEITLREAGQWAISFSKAWRAGRASGDVFWVHPDQVTKTAPSGEFVARGAWMIHGQKEWLRDLPLELGLGTFDYEGESRWSASPPSALRSRGTLRVVVRPGVERDRPRLETELARELGVSRSELQRLLPGGGFVVIRA